MQQNTAMADTYNDTYKLIYSVCVRFARSRGGDVEDYLSCANEVFVDAYNTYNAASGTFPTYLCSCLRKRLRDLCNYNRRRRPVRAASIDVPDENGHTLAGTVVDQFCTFDTGAFLQQLSADGAHVASLVLHATQQMVETVESKGGRKSNWRSTVRDTLRAAGWGGQRIRDAFAEIRSAL
jgi:DNA-directed RNA polymerase specialized sigma24 family protein